jgi:hypothetical protein
MLEKLPKACINGYSPRKHLEKRRFRNTLNMGAKPTPDQWWLSFYKLLLYSKYKCKTYGLAFGGL